MKKRLGFVFLAFLAGLIAQGIKDTQGGGGGTGSPGPGLTPAALAAMLIPGADGCVGPGAVNGADVELPADVPGCLEPLAFIWDALHKFDVGYIDVKQVAAPANPGAGYNRIYSDVADGGFKCKTPAGASCISSSSGGSTIGTALVPAYLHTMDPLTGGSSFGTISTTADFAYYCIVEAHAGMYIDRVLFYQTGNTPGALMDIALYDGAKARVTHTGVIDMNTGGGDRRAVPFTPITLDAGSYVAVWSMSDAAATIGGVVISSVGNSMSGGTVGKCGYVAETLNHTTGLPATITTMTQWTPGVPMLTWTR